MPRLCVDLSFLPERPTGLGTYALNLLGHLPREELAVLTPRPLAGIHCLSVPKALSSERGRRGHLARLWWRQTRLPMLYRRLQAQLLFSPVPEAPLNGGCRYVVTVHDLIPLRFPGRFPALLTSYFRHFVPHVLARAEHILCDSQATAADIVQFYGIAEQKITPVALAHDADHFYPRHLPKKNYFLYVGRQDTYKNLSRMIAAFAVLPEEYEFWLAGPADARQAPLLHAQVDALQLGGRVRFLDYVPYARLPELFEQAVALMFPTLWEGFGLPVLEAMACGTPVITSRLSSLPEVAGDAALLVDPYCIGEIAEAMRAVALDTELCARLSAEGLKRAGQFSWQRTGEQTARILQQFL
jgi:glycosyltransferase involved in cell wall biosynthesis